MNKDDKIIDVSEWNDHVDWNKVKNTDVKGVILRCGYGKQSIDKYFFENAKGCIAAGVPIIGVYHFMYAINNQEAKINAENAIKLVKSAGLPGDTTIWADVEYDTVDNAKKKGVNLGKAEIDLFTKTFCEAVKSAGYKTGIYLNNDYRINYYYPETLKKYDLWLADYSGGPDVPCLIQQTGYSTVSGIVKKVDTNTWIGDRTEKTANVQSATSTEKPRSYLKKGDRGDNVKELQETLIYCGISCGSSGADGIYGNDTEKAVKLCQNLLGCAQDGIHGAETKKALAEFYKYVKIYKKLTQK